MKWLIFALMTVLSWGVYGVFLHTGQMGMADQNNGRYKAFLLVGVAYFIVAILCPLAILVFNGSTWSFPMKGIVWSLLAGIVGALGAFFVLVSLGAGGKPTYVMSVVFAGAPIVNALVALSLHPPAGGWTQLRWQFVVGILLAAIGGFLVVRYKDPKPVSAGPVLEKATGLDMSKYKIT
ncbi:MAG: hypothetical protein AAF514_02465 [Verrucomicrobiota bacterium]